MGNNAVKNILVVNVNWIGDVIFSTPVFRALRQKYPRARIVCMAVPRVVPVLKCCPYLDDIIEYDEKGRHRLPWNKLAFVFHLRKSHFDVAFLLHRSWTRALLVYLAGVSHRVGYDLKNLGRMLTLKVEFPLEEIHRSDYYLKVVEAFGVDVTDRTTELVPTEKARRDVSGLLSLKGVAEKDFVVILNMGGNWPLKRWPKEYFGALIDRLMSELKLKVVISGSPKDRALVEDVCVISQMNPIVMAGKTDLDQTFALMERADVVVSADSGPLHIASSVGTTTIAIFGPTRPEITGPRGKGEAIVLQEDLDCNAQACYQLDCPDNRCMKAVSVDDVVREVGKIYRSENC